MKEFAETLKIIFFIGNTVLAKRENYTYSKLSEDGSLYLNLNNAKDRAILDLIMKCDTLHIDGAVYKVLGREFMFDGTGLYISLEKDEEI